MIKIAGLREEATRNFKVSTAYEGKFYTSITIACAAALTALISFSSNYKEQEQYFHSMLGAFWLLFVGVLLSGILPLILSLQHKQAGNTNIDLAQLDILMSAVEKGTLDQKSTLYVATENSLEKSNDKYILWRNVKVVLLVLSISCLVLGMIFPLLKLTLCGSLL